MRILRRTLSFIIVSIFLLSTIQYNTYAQTPVRVAVFLSNFSSPFISNLKNNLENIQKENNIQFTFFDSKANEVIQNENIENGIGQNYNFYVIDLVNSSSGLSKDSLNKLFTTNAPALFILLPNNEMLSYIRTYSKAIIIGADDSEAGTLQDKILADAWNSNKQSFDRNKDNIMQYIMLLGPINDPSTTLRTRNSIQSLKNECIQLQELASVPCKWNKECAKTNTESLFIRFGNKIDAIISNNDAIPEAQELVKQGIMTGTIVQDTQAYTDAIYSIGINMLSDVNALEGTNYKFDETGKVIKLPYHIYTP